MTYLPDNLFVWVLAPLVQTEDPNLDYYYDFTQSIQEYSDVFQKLEIDWQWQQVTNRTYRKVIDQIAEEATQRPVVVLNLCDGDDINKAPGVNVIRYLRKKGVCFTGAEEYFYRVTSSKIAMKEVFESRNVPTAPWRILSPFTIHDKQLFNEIGTPVIVKPAVSGGSLGVNTHSVVDNLKDLAVQYRKVAEGYHGWKIGEGGIMAEKFVTGPEFTTLIVGDSTKPSSCKVYPPVERVFHHSLSPTEKFLSFDRLWEIYDEEDPVRNDEDFYKYFSPDPQLIPEIEKVSLHAYKAVRGKGYCRVDLRMDSSTGKLYVLEVNSQCGLSDDENFTSIGAILRLSENPFSSLVAEILKEAIVRKKIRSTRPVSEFIFTS